MTGSQTERRSVNREELKMDRKGKDGEKKERNPLKADNTSSKDSHRKSRRGMSEKREPLPWIFIISGWFTYYKCFKTCYLNDFICRIYSKDHQNGTMKWA